MWLTMHVAQVTDVMSVFGICTMSLRTGKAISEVLPRSLVDRIYYHQSLTPPFDDDDGDEADTHTTLSPTPRARRPASHHHRLLTEEIFTSEEYAFYATGLAGAFQILLALDETRGICADLCGEVPLRGFEDWRREFELRQLGERV